QGGNRSLVLFSDGRPTAGGEATAAAGNLPVHAVPVGGAGDGLFTQRLILPEAARAGETAPLRWQVWSGGQRSVTVTVAADGRVLGKERVAIPAGRNDLDLRFTVPGPGLHRVTLEVADDEGRPLAEAAGAGLLRVEGPRNILVVRDVGRSSPLTPALRTQGLAALERGVPDVPGSAVGLAGYAAVVLDDVAATALNAGQRKALASYVASGGGLLVVGGERSLGRGEYYATELEDLLPVQTDTRQRLFFSRANVLFVIDHSGSMSEMVGRTSKQMAAMRGVSAAIGELDPEDEVGVLTFDTEATWVLPFTPAGRRREIDRALAAIGEGGGTDMTSALREAARAFQDRGPVRRHVIFLTDGLSEGEGFELLCRRLRDMGATISTIAVGEQINEDLLRSMARWGKGRYYRATLDQIPRVMLQETVRISRDLIQEGLFTPGISAPADYLGGLEGGVPPVRGYLVTKPKRLATVNITVGKGDPLLAVWRYGNGKVAVFASDSGRRWLAPWSGLPAYNRFWSQIVRHLERTAPDEGLRLSVWTEAGQVRVVAEALGPDRRFRTGLHLTGRVAGENGEAFNLVETAPGRYEATLPARKGWQDIEVRDTLEGGWAVGGVWNPPSAEMRAAGPDFLYLGRLSAANRGKVLSLAAPHLPEPRLSWEPVPLAGALVVLALLLFAAELVCRSTLLGQLTMARAALAAWWDGQTRLQEQAWAAAPAKTPDSAAATERWRDARRYLSERARAARGEVRPRE
ncbi:MAG: VWA domain-containing protein, partial [Bacteroidota bacterium]